MTVTSVHKDPTSHTMTLEAEFNASPERVWQLWEDPRQLERWWGPPSYPATVDSHDLRPGGTVHYHMTGAEGDEHHGYWNIEAVEAPHRLVLLDGFAEADGPPNTDLPVTKMTVTIEDIGGNRTRMSIESAFPSVEAMEQLIAMGMDEGMTQAAGQIDAILAENP
ncbi:MAG: SRPBCC domain-containing protein [Dehalococcoidia bacterium]